MPTPRPTVRALVAGGATLLGLSTVLAMNPLSSSATLPDRQTSASTPTADQASSVGSSTSSESESATETTTAPTAETTASEVSASEEAAATTTTSTDGTYTGSTYQSPYGPMQVSITTSGGQITDITWVQLPSDHHSQEINSYAASALVEEALNVQSADVESISGASYTSEAFVTSLQSAIEEAGLTTQTAKAS